MKTENNNINVMADKKQHTKGEWCYVATSPERINFNILTYGSSTERNGTGTLTLAKVESDNIWNYSKEEAEANAKLIVTAVNNHYKLIEALKDILMNCYTYDNGMKHVPDAFINSAKELLKQIEQQ